MKIDLTLPISKDMWHAMRQQAIAVDEWERFGHLGTHFDVMDQEFPLEYCERRGRVFDVSHIRDRDIVLADIDVNRIREQDCVLFHTGWLKEKQYGTSEYFHASTTLASELIRWLVDKQVNLIGIDLAGIRPAAEHRDIDSYCAQHGTFIIENLYNLGALVRESASRELTVSTYPLRIHGVTGLPCRVVATLQ